MINDVKFNYIHLDSIMMYKHLQFERSEVGEEFGTFGRRRNQNDGGFFGERHGKVDSLRTSLGYRKPIDSHVHFL